MLKLGITFFPHRDGLAYFGFEVVYISEQLIKELLLTDPREQVKVQKSSSGN